MFRTFTTNSTMASAIRKPSASWAPVGWGYAAGHDFLDRGFFNAVMAQGAAQLGPATVLGKTYLWANSSDNRDLIDTFVLLGDPGSRLPVNIPKTLLPFISRQP